MKKLIYLLLFPLVAFAQVAVTGPALYPGQVLPAAPSGGAATFSSVTITGLTPTRVPFVTTGGLLTDAAAFTFNSGTGALSATSFVGNTAASTITGTTLAANVVTSSITGTGPLNSGSITSGFGAIDVGADSITGGAISGTTGTFTGMDIVNPAANVTLSIGSFNGLAARNNTLRIDTAGAANFGTLGFYVGGTLTSGIRVSSAGANMEFINGAGSTIVGTVTSTGLNNTVIGATTPAAGSFTTLAATGVLTSARATITGSGTGGGTTTATVNINEAGVRQWSIGAGYAVSGELAVINGSTGLSVLDIKTTGLAVTGTVNTTTGYISDKTITAGGTTGNQTINKPQGTVNFAAAATTLTVTNSLVTTSSVVVAVIRTNDSTATLKNVVPAAGSFTITLTAAATAETSVGFMVFN